MPGKQWPAKQSSSSLALATSLSHATTCYGVNGLSYDKQVACPGTGACCGDDATCLTNQLCHNPGDDQDFFTRGPCSVEPWDAVKCAAICVYNETEHHNKHFPRVSLCADGSFCCSNEPDCCKEGNGVFLDDEGNVVDSTATSSSASSTATDAPATDAPAPAKDGQLDSTALKVGLSLGIPQVFIVASIGVAIFLKRRHRAAVTTNAPDDTVGAKYKNPPQPPEYADEPAVVPRALGPRELTPRELDRVPAPTELGVQLNGARWG